MKYTLKTYLAGPIQIIPEFESKEWRQRITKELNAIDIECFNPLGQFGGDRLGKIRQKMQKWNEDGHLDAIRKNGARRIIPPDLKMVEDSDFITVWIPKRVQDFDLDKISNVSSDSEAERYIESITYEICGTYGEVTLAFYLHKPVFIVTNRSLKPLELPQWLVGCSTLIFTTWNEYLNYISDNKKYLRRWSERQRLYKVK